MHSKTTLLEQSGVCFDRMNKSMPDDFLRSLPDRDSGDFFLSDKEP
ncbi:MAG: hypothetical protein K1X56_13265 [Flavobacteriales bacterium]|nr:hypothetical protein [Flavobacteriales bacterium]